RSTAAVLCGAADLARKPYVLTPGPARSSFAAAAVSSAEGHATFPFLAGPDLLATIARPPRRELPGVPLVAPHAFDVAVDPAAEAGIRLGTVLDRTYERAAHLVV